MKFKSLFFILVALLVVSLTGCSYDAYTGGGLAGSERMLAFCGMCFLGAISSFLAGMPIVALFLFGIFLIG